MKRSPFFSRGLRALSCAGLFLWIPAIFAAGDRYATLAQPVEFPLMLNGAKLGSVRQPQGTRVRILQENAGRVQIAIASGTTWVAGAAVNLPQAQSADAPAAAPAISPVPPTLAKQPAPVQANKASAGAQEIQDPETNRIYQYFVPSKITNARQGSGAYLWIPPGTPKIRAVMVGIHNGLPLTILQHPLIRAVCRQQGIAQILLTPNGSEIGPVMLKDLNFDVTDPAKTTVYDRYLEQLAAVSEHPELVAAPIIPLAHSAYMSFAFDAAIRRPEQCLCALPIKAGTPDVYAFYAQGGKSKSPAPDLCLRSVPLLVLDSAGQETVVSRWKSSPYPQVFEPNFVNAYRKDHPDNPGTNYEPRNELIGACWDMLSGHFDLFPRNYRFVAEWLEAIAQARLPEKPGDPLKNLTLKDGWLMDPRVPTGPDVPPSYAMPAKYLEFKGNRAKALWFPTERLAKELFDLQRSTARNQVELFTVLDSKGQPVSLAETPMAVMPSAFELLKGEGLWSLSTWRFTVPPQICTIQEKGHGKNPGEEHKLANALFPGKEKLGLSGLPVQCDPNGGPLEVIKREEFTDTRGVAETRFTLKLKFNRLAPATGYQQFYPRLYTEGNGQFSPTGRTAKIEWDLNGGKNRADQKITFPPIPDAKFSAAKVNLKATASSVLKVDYFVQNGPGIIQGNDFVPMEIPAGANKPIEVTIGAYQVGSFSETGGFKCAPTVYQNFKLIP